MLNKQKVNSCRLKYFSVSTLLKNTIMETTRPDKNALGQCSETKASNFKNKSANFFRLG